MSLPLPPNVHVSKHPCLRAKLSQLRSQSTNSRDVQTLVHEIALMVGYEALAQGLETKDDGTVSFFRCPKLPSTHLLTQFQFSSTPPPSSPNLTLDSGPLAALVRIYPRDYHAFLDLSRSHPPLRP